MAGSERGDKSESLVRDPTLTKAIPNLSRMRAFVLTAYLNGLYSHISPHSHRQIFGQPCFACNMLFFTMYILRDKPHRADVSRITSSGVQIIHPQVSKLFPRRSAP